jgi:GGDEF domain-containing protein
VTVVAVITFITIVTACVVGFAALWDARRSALVPAGQSVDLDSLQADAQQDERVPPRPSSIGTTSDPVTRMPTAEYLSHVLRYEVARSQTFARRLSLVVISLGGMSRVSEEGDARAWEEVMAVMASRLSRVLPPFSVPIRIDDSEFAVALVERDLEYAFELARKVESDLARPVHRRVTLVIRVGAAETHANDTAEGLLAEARRAMESGATALGDDPGTSVRVTVRRRGVRRGRPDRGDPDDGGH